MDRPSLEATRRICPRAGAPGCELGPAWGIVEAAGRSSEVVCRLDEHRGSAPWRRRAGARGRGALARGIGVRGRGALARGIGLFAALLALASVGGCPEARRGSARSDASPPRLLPPDDAAASPAPRDAAAPDGGAADAEGRGRDAAPDARGAEPVGPEARASAAPDAPLALGRWDHSDGPVRRAEAHRLDRRAHEALAASDLDAAEALWQEAIRADPSFDRAYGELCVVHMRREDHRACVAAASRCLASALDQDVLGACGFNLGLCQSRLGDEAAAADAFRLSLEARSNAATERALGRATRRLGRGSPAPIDRERREAAVRAAASAFLSTACQGPQRSDRPGVLGCGDLSTWGVAGAFSRAGAEEVLLAVAEVGRGGAGVLMGREAGIWSELARSDLLASDDGGVDFEGLLPRADGTAVAVAQVTSCVGGCCRGDLEAVSVEASPGGPRLVAERLAPVGSSAAAGGAPALSALVTAARRLADEVLGGPALLLRYETRAGRGDPALRYLRVRLDGRRPRLDGAAPPPLPPCAETGGASPPPPTLR